MHVESPKLCFSVFDAVPFFGGSSSQFDVLLTREIFWTTYRNTYQKLPTSGILERKEYCRGFLKTAHLAFFWWKKSSGRQEPSNRPAYASPAPAAAAASPTAPTAAPGRAAPAKPIKPMVKQEVEEEKPEVVKEKKPEVVKQEKQDEPEKRLGIF